MKHKLLILFFLILLITMASPTAEAGKTWFETFSGTNEAKLFQEAGEYLASCECQVVSVGFMRGHGRVELYLTLESK